MEGETVYWDHTEKRPPLEQPWLDSIKEVVTVLERASKGSRNDGIVP